MSDKLYYADPSLLTFTSRVTSCRPGGTKGSWAVELEASAFYPGGGGQPADKGTLTPEGGSAVEVLDVATEGAAVCHYTGHSIAPDTLVTGTIDTARRLHYMQQHTGQHILSAVMYHELNIDTLSVHLGSDYSAIEIHSPELLDDTVIRRIEDKANEIIRSSIPVKQRNPRSAESAGFLRRELKTTEDIRIIEIEGYDAVGCGGVHCSLTSGVELILWAGQEKIRGNVRTKWIIGQKAFEDVREKRIIVHTLTARYSAPQTSLVQRMEEEDQKKAALARELGIVKKRYADLCACELNRRGRQVAGSILYTGIYGDLDMNDLREVANLITAQGSRIAVLLSRSGDKGSPWILAVSHDCPFDFAGMKDRFLALIGGKGGGRHPQWQGSWDPSTGITEDGLFTCFGS
ncbi:MAG: alanyl-tRNA editing protein [Spirochaetales bacterium]|nr:alanyl-tRNA editing protein [Spirochaetales bacterium]